MRLIDADLLKDNIKSWTEKIKGSRTDSQCFFTEENVLSAIDQCETVELTNSETENEDIEWLEENEDLQDVMIRAARKARFSRIKAKEVFDNKGILEIYNLGMKHMYDYLLNRIGE